MGQRYASENVLGPQWFYRDIHPGNFHSQTIEVSKISLKFSRLGNQFDETKTHYRWLVFLCARRCCEVSNYHSHVTFAKRLWWRNLGTKLLRRARTIYYFWTVGLMAISINAKMSKNATPETHGASVMHCHAYLFDRRQRSALAMAMVKVYSLGG